MGKSKVLWNVNDIVRLRADGGGWRVWQVVGIFLGGVDQEDVIELQTLDREENTQGKVLVPREILDVFDPGRTGKAPGILGSVKGYIPYLKRGGPGTAGLSQSICCTEQIDCERCKGTGIIRESSDTENASKASYQCPSCLGTRTRCVTETPYDLREDQCAACGKPVEKSDEKIY